MTKATRQYNSDLELSAELRELLEDIDNRGEGLTDWEIGFVSNLIDHRAKRFTTSQARQIRRIHQDRVS